MSLFANLLRSLVITAIFCFLAPVLLIGGIWAVIYLASYLPYLQTIQSFAIEQLSQFLMIFGSGSVLRGILIIGLVCSLVGVLFDTYIFYRYQKLNN